MSQVERELQDYDKAGLWPIVYQKLKNEASIVSIQRDFETVSARKPENRSKNRYRDVSPYDHSQVILNKGDNSYINASLIEVASAKRRYILTQGPLEHTAGQFWQMVWEQNTKAVIMLNRVVEKGTPKCCQYWPLGVDNGFEDELVFEDSGLKITLLDEQELNHYTVRTLEVEDVETGSTREVLHFHYITWPDFGVPSSPLAFLNFLMAVRQSGGLDNDVGPSIIHCSAGIGRSGTFCLVDSSLVMIEESNDMNCIDVKSLLLDMRSYRMGLIQTADQLRFSYMAIIEGGRRILADANAVDSVVSAYMENHREESPPPPPVRTTSLKPSPQRESPPPPPPRDGQFDDADNHTDHILPEEVSNSLRHRVTEKIENSEPAEDNISAYEIRRRKRDDRKKNTQEQLEKMRQKQKESELWKERNSYLRPVIIGISILIGGLLLYRYYL